MMAISGQKRHKSVAVVLNSFMMESKRNVRGGQRENEGEGQKKRVSVFVCVCVRGLNRHLPQALITDQHSTYIPML